MSKRKSEPVIITPEIQAQIDKWQVFAKEHDIVLSKVTNMPFCAKTTAETGHCNCHYNRKCPCEQIWVEIKTTGHCFCKVFWSPEAHAKELAERNK